MSRRGMSVLLAASLIAATLPACSGGPEDAILTRFFAAARLHDRTALGSFATVDFDPREQGIVTTFTITAIAPEQRRALALKAPANDDAAEKGLVELSAFEPGRALDVTAYEGDSVSKDVTISAPVKLPSGDTVTKTLVITLKRAELKGDTPIVGRWIVARIVERRPSGT